MIANEDIVGQVHDAQAVVCVWRYISHGETEPAVVCGGIVVVKRELRAHTQVSLAHKNDMSGASSWCLIQNEIVRKQV